MSKFTDFLNLFKWDAIEDAEEEFNINKALNENWDKIDDKLKIHITNTNKTVQELSDLVSSTQEFHKYIITTTTEEIPENTNYEIPCKYKVGEDVLDIYYMGEKLIKDVHYKEVGENGTVSNKIQFFDWGQSVPVNRTIEFVVRGVYVNES